MLVRFCTDTIFASVLAMMFFTNARVVLHASGRVCYDSKQLTTLAISNNILAFLEIALIMSMHQSGRLGIMMTSLYILLAIAFVLINLVLTFVITPATVENVLNQDYQTQHQKRPLVTKTVNELLLMTMKHY